MEENVNQNEIETVEGSEEVTAELSEGVEVEEISEEETGEVSDIEKERAEIEELRAQKLLIAGEIAMLDGELERKRAETDKAAREYAEFRELYPDADPEALEPEVLEAVESGIPLAAAYALYEKRLQKRNADAAAHNKSTRQSAFGSVGKAAESDYFTPDEVRAMTQGEVRANYSKILQSMKSWH